MRPPIGAIKKISEYCKKNNCARCDFGQIYDQTNISCTLLETLPVYWYEEEKDVLLKATRTKEQKTDKV